MTRALEGGTTNSPQWRKPTAKEKIFYERLQDLDGKKQILKIKAQVYMTSFGELNKTISKRGKYPVADGIRYMPWKHKPTASQPSGGPMAY